MRKRPIDTPLHRGRSGTTLCIAGLLEGPVQRNKALAKKLGERGSLSAQLFFACDKTLDEDDYLSWTEVSQTSRTGTISFSLSFGVNRMWSFKLGSKVR